MITIRGNMFKVVEAQKIVSCYLRTGDVWERAYGRIVPELETTGIQLALFNYLNGES